MSNRFSASAQDKIAFSRPRRSKAIHSAARACVESLETRVLMSSVLSPVADTFVRDHDYALTNFGASPMLIVKQANSGDNRVAFVKFDLSGVSTVSHAVLQMTGKLSNELATPVDTGVYGVADSSWVEGDGTIVNNVGDGFDTDNSPAGEMTWNNQPGVSTGALATVTISRDTYQTYTWDVTSYLQDQLNAGNTQVTLALENIQPTELLTQFLSREASGPGPGPELIITGNETAPPTASISAADVNSPASSENISVTYSSAAGINGGSIDASDLSVTGPNGPLAVTGVTTSGDANNLTAVYTVAAPNGSWSPGDNGAYTVVVQPNAVQDVNGTSVARTVGSFRVNVGDATPPTGTISATDLTSAGGATYSFNVTYSDNVAIDASSINIDNVGVNGPNGALKVVGVSLSPNGNAGTVVATYTVAAPSGAWSASDNGHYIITLRTRQVLDTAGNPAPGASGGFNVAISVPDTTPPSATISAPNITAPGGATEDITVIYSDNVDVNAASIDPGDLSIVGPGGVTLNVLGVNISPNGNAGTVTAVYTVAAPNGAWSAGDNGTYTISLNPGQVTDTSGNAAQPVGGLFNVSASIGDNSPPTGSISAPAISTAGGGTQTVTVVYRDNVAVNASTINTDDISVSGPSGPLTVTGVTFSPIGDAGTITATYTVAAPNGGWDASFDGTYTVALNANQVVDTSGNAVPVTFGSFAVNIPMPNPLDTTFATAGGNFVSTPFVAETVVTLPNGQILVAGHQASGSGSQAVLESLNADGTVNTKFGTNGQVVTPAGATDAWYAIAVQGTSHVLVAGTHNGDFAVARFDFDGNLDPTFGSRGVTFTDFGLTNDVAYAIALAADNSIVLGGNSNNSFAFARYNANGVLNTAFGEGGRQLFNTGGSGQTVGAIAFQNDGRIVAAGASGSQLAVVRLTAAGDTDSTFGNAGLVSVGGLAARVDGSSPDHTEGLALQGDGKIIVANRTTGGHFGVARLNANGSLDTSFGSGGIASADFGGEDDADSIVLQPTGEVLVTGTSLQGGTAYTAVAAFDSRGRAITTFGNSGKSIFSTGVAPTSRELHIGDLVYRAFGGGTSGGKLLVGTSASGVTTTSSSLRRLNVPGSKGSLAVTQILLGVFGMDNGKKTRLVVHDPTTGAAITLQLSGGTGQATQVGNVIQLDITAAAGQSVVLSISVKGGNRRATFGDITITGGARNISAKNCDITGTLHVTGSLGNAVLGNVPGNIQVDGSINNLSAGDLGGTLSAGSSIGNLRLGKVTGVIAAGGSIRNITAASLAGAKVLSGTNLGSDGKIGGSGTAADKYGVGSINSIRVRDQITNSSVDAGIDPVDAAYGNSNDKEAGGAASLIRSINARGADTASKFEAGGFKNVRLGKKVDPATDPRFKTV